MTADALASEVAFFSIGTNDLVQYTLAVDRGNANLAARFTPLHPAVLRLIQRTLDAGNAHGIEVSVCGEMASEPLMAFALIGLGIRTLSVSPRSVSRVKQIVRRIHTALASEAAAAALGAGTAQAAEAIFRARLDAEGGEGSAAF
jgi:phosphotransferase system enzyme I (PtsI)